MSEPKKPGNIFGTCSKPQLFWLKRDEPNFVPKPVPFIETHPSHEFQGLFKRSGSRFTSRKCDKT
jgi:hypothetical protein